MGYYEDTVRAQTAEEYANAEYVNDILFNVSDLALTLKNISVRLIQLEKEVDWLKRGPIIG
jgi:hypothetical protein